MMLGKQQKSFSCYMNAHYKVLDLKFKKTELGKYFEAAIKIFEMGYPKEMLEFWEKAEKSLDLREGKDTLVDDTEEILKTAREYGIKYNQHHLSN